MKTSAFRLVLLASLSAATLAGATVTPALNWPKVTPEAKPWTRWWWLGNIGTKQDFTTRMEQYAAAGFGGLEIVPIYGVRGEESRFRQFLSPSWVDLFEHVLDEGQRLDLGIDMTTGNGWPFGGPWVTPDMACRDVEHVTWTLKGGQRLTGPVRFVQQPLVTTAGPRQVTIDELKEPIAANPDLQDLALFQVRFRKSLPLQVLMAYSAAGEKLDLTGKVGADGTLDWVAPPGDWTLYAVFVGWHGKQVERAGPGGEGDVIDHFSTAAVKRYLAHFDAALAGRDLSRVHAWFNDSYEVDDAQGESDWTPRFFQEFQRRRGYDLRAHLPALFGHGDSDEVARVTSDYRETISDLLLDAFTQTWARWAARHGALVRNQAHGSPANILDLYAASGIPETEGASVAGMKLASSAAHLTGRPLASSELATWLGEHWCSTLGDIRRRADLTFLAGINQMNYHGTAFSPPGEPWPGFHFYASVEMDPTNAFWADVPVLNTYLTRVQSFLQAGRPANDVLLYYGLDDVWARRGNGTLPHFGPRPPRGATGELARTLLNEGYTFDYVSDRLLSEVHVTGGVLRRKGAAAWRVVLVPATGLMPLPTLAKLVTLARAGATILIQDHLPADVPGLGDLAHRRAEFHRLLDEVGRTHIEGAGISVAAVGHGRFIFGTNVRELLSAAGVRRESMVDQGLRFERRALGTDFVYFISNPGNETFSGWVALPPDAKSAAIFDPTSGRSGMATTRPGAGGPEVYLQLDAAGTCLVRTFPTAIDGPAFRYWTPAGDTAPLTGTWTVHFGPGGPSLPSSTQLAALTSWTDFAGAAGKVYAGSATYSLTFARPTGPAVAWQLDLGRVAESAHVRLNGHEIAALIQPPFRVIIPADRLRTQNSLEVVVTNLSANRIADLDRRGVHWKKFYNANYPARLRQDRGPDGLFTAARWQPRDSGLLGPVTLTPAAPAPEAAR